MTGASSLKWKPTKKTNLDLYASVFNTDEREYFDILGQYFINLLEKDPSKEEFGDSIATLGIGSYLNHARNRLNATIYNIYHNGQHTFNDKHKLLWGAGYQFDVFSDVLSEWKLVDSAGYSLPQTFTTSGDLQLNEVIKGKLELTNQRYNAYAQHVWEWKKVTNDFPDAGPPAAKITLNKYLSLIPSKIGALKESTKLLKNSFVFLNVI
jgi:hypothetical protein